MLLVLLMIGLTMLLIYLCFTSNKESFYINKSRIEGIGIFSDNDYNSNIFLFRGINNNKEITYLGSKINHCNNPNTYLVKTKDGWDIYSKTDIKKNEELTIDYNYTPNFIKKPNPNWKC